MTKPAAISKADCTRLARVAKAENVCIEVQAGPHIIRILPTDPEKPIDERREIDLG